MTRQRTGWHLALWALWGVLMSPVAGLAEPPRSTHVTNSEPRQAAGPAVARVDVALDTEGVLHGQLVDTQGVPIVGAQVELRQSRQRVAAIRTDVSGHFSVPLPRGGSYQLITETNATVVRVWTSQAAPPGCARALVVVQGDTVRGQSGKSAFPQMNAWVIAGVVAVAVAVPVALHNNRSGRANGS